LRFRDGAGRPLPTHVSDSPFAAEPVILTPGDTAFIDLTWPVASRSCRGISVADIAVNLPRVRGRFDIRAQSDIHPFAPCRGEVRADAIS
jgi:hypothetical protein